jgi:membrane-associated HD superfamily phosphohydrolase
MAIDKNIIRIVSSILLVIGLFLPLMSVSFLGMSKGISLFSFVTNIQSIPLLGDDSRLVMMVYAIFLIYLISIVTCVLAIFKDSKSLTILSGITALIYSGIVFLEVLALKSDLSSFGTGLISAAIGSVASDMVTVGIGVGVSFLASLLLFGTLFIEK